MKIWKAELLIGTTDEYSQVQALNLRNWFEEFEQQFKHDFSYIRLKIGTPEYAGSIELEEWAYPEHVQEWQKEADSLLEKCLEEQSKEIRLEKGKTYKGIVK